MTRTTWPKLCTLADAARLFTEIGHAIDRSNLSRWVKKENFPRVDGKVDPEALFLAWSKDTQRLLMAGKMGGPAAPPPPPASAPHIPTPAAPAAPSPADFLPPGDDPRRDLLRMQAQRMRLEMETEAGNLVPAEEVAATAAEAIADMRAAFAQALNDAAKNLTRSLSLPAHREALVKSAFRAYAQAGQKAFAAPFAKLLADSTPSDMDARARIDRLIALDLELRGVSAATEGDEPAPEPSPDPQA